MQIAVDLPKEFVTFQGVQHIQKEILLSYALWLFQQSRITLSKGAQLAGMDIYEFMHACKANNVHTIGIEPEELAEELAGFKTP